MVIDRLNELLATLGKEAGIAVSLDEGGECVLEREDGGECVINAPSDGSAFAMSAVLGFVHRNDGVAFLSGLLQLNGDIELMLGGGLSLDESGDAIVYRYVMEADGLDGEGLKTLIDNFFTVTDNLREEIEALREAAAEGEDESPPPRPAGPGDEGFVRA